MCTVCGCGGHSVEDQFKAHLEKTGQAMAAPKAPFAVLATAAGAVASHSHSHDHGTIHAHGAECTHDIHLGHGPAGTEVPGMTQARLVEIETDILSKNNSYAARNRENLAKKGVFATNLVSSPGSGKTTLLVKTIEMLGGAPLAVIEGDQQTTNDADRIRATGAPAIQVNTGKGCHLDGAMIEQALALMPLPVGALLFIENVGNLVCPAAFDLGEDAKVAILSVTEGEDKPLKYPDMFAAAGLALINKVDLAPHCDVDLDLYEANIRRVNPAIDVLRVSARTGEGMQAWLDWLRAGLARKAS
ncbi:hydrogenase nickel incorporation protein HypB [Rhodobacter sp. JA431]|uniref:hydrogenase nickel incorporation protein HypB n=1 Tax=Rhodobacter sp. JA431 TaxID=570013 RepID=UPI000BDB5E37|nr:hydrogenase nickel incorporation protein HypB [Rhodobacter sp. JA431]SOB89827.1 hydrogenase nickel incorporation protein HypB [Rhodobacter sp. JA431]